MKLLILSVIVGLMCGATALALINFHDFKSEGKVAIIIAMGVFAYLYVNTRGRRFR